MMVICRFTDTEATDPCRAAHECNDRNAMPQDNTPPVPTRPDDTMIAGRDAGLVARLGAEAFGSFFLVLVGLGIALYTNLSGAGALGTSFGFGLALVGGTIVLGHVSGGHFNPAVTIGAAVAGRIAWRDVVPYWVAQIVGAVLAGGVLFLTIPSKLPALVQQGVPGASTKTFFAQTANGYAVHSPLSALSQAQAQFGLVPALLVEAVATAVLVGVVLAATSQRVARTVAPFAIGLTYAVLLLLAAPITGGGLNPARSTAAAIFSGGGAVGQLWLFWVAPLLGAVLAAVVYRAALWSVSRTTGPARPAPSRPRTRTNTPWGARPPEPSRRLPGPPQP